MSAEFTNLESRLSDLKKYFLAPTNRIKSQNKKKDYIRSFVLLAYAAIEDYFETIALRKLAQSKSNWKRQRSTSLPLLAVVAYSSKSSNEMSLNRKIDEAIKEYSMDVFKNHGVKSENILTLLRPIGVKKEELDPTWLITIDDFGKTRGEYAHKTIFTQSILDANATWSQINQNIMDEIIRLDHLIDNL